MKKILGLDLGTGSIGWAFVHEAVNEKDTSRIIKTGVRVIHYGDNIVKKDKSGNISASKEPIQEFSKGMSLSMNAGRTKMRGMRRNLQRYKQRRANLIEILKENGIIKNDTKLFEHGNNSTFETLRLRALAATEQIELDEFARVLLMINKKRGYKSSRKAKTEEESNAIDSMGVAKEIYNKSITPGQYVYSLLVEGKKIIPDFYRSDLMGEFDKTWDFQKKYYPETFTDEHYKQLLGLNRGASLKYFKERMDIEPSEVKGNANKKRLEKYKIRSASVEEQKTMEEVAFALLEINNDINKSSGYLGEISDRSKELYFNNLTVGEYLYNQVKNNSHARLKKQVFYRQDYLDEFEKIWEVQNQKHHQLSPELKKEIRDCIIFYQRKLKSQKHLIVDCEFEKGHKAIPKSSPLFQEFRILQNLNNTIVKFSEQDAVHLTELNKNGLNELLVKLRWSNFIKGTELKQILGLDKKVKLNFKQLEGNRTCATILKACHQIMRLEGLEPEEPDSVEEVKVFFDSKGFDSSILDFDISYLDDEFSKSRAFQFWHMLYSAEDDAKLKAKLISKYGFNESAAKVFTNISFESDYGRLSSRAIRRLLPYLKEGLSFSDACDHAGYNHSKSITKEENETRVLKEKLDLIPIHSLRNPIVEKILNQVINQVNAIIEHPKMGRPDEIRIEMARELKKGAEERREMTEGIEAATKKNNAIKEKLKKEFNFKHVTKNAVIRYKLWEECGHTSIYTGKPIPRGELFGNKYDIEHVIPKAKLFDDSFSNKILCERSWNEEKGDQTAYDYLKNKLSNEEFENYLVRVEKLYKDKKSISKTKFKKLTMRSEDIPDDFIERQLRESQFIAKKASEILLSVTRNVTTTIGAISDRLREDWGLVDIMKELNWEKYKALGLTEIREDKDGRRIKRINGWNKRNDHRHHAMDAITVAFTKRAYVQYLNNLNSRKDKSSEAYQLEQKYLYRDDNNRLRFKLPMPEFRQEAQKQLEKTLISFKPSTKVATINKNRVKLKNGKEHVQIVMTPRGQLHNESVYGRIKKYKTKMVTVGGKMTRELAEKIANKREKEAVLQRLMEFSNDPKKAFGGKNSLKKNPIYLNGNSKELPAKVKVVDLVQKYTIKKEVSPELKIDKVIDKGVKKVLELRVKEFGGDQKLAFSNLEENPIWLNKEKGIQVKRVKITAIRKGEALHVKKDQTGLPILEQESEVANDFVNTGNNHHVAIYEDSEGNLTEEVVSFYEAVERKRQGLDVLKTINKEGHNLKFTLKRNEYFVFPNKDFNPSEMDLTDPANYPKISPNLFRVQKISSGEYFFRHHLETTVVTPKELAGISYKRIRSISNLKNIINVRINRLGEIIKTDEI